MPSQPDLTRTSHAATPPTFPQAVADVGVPSQEGVPAAEAQHGGVCQAEDGQSVGHAVKPGPWLHTADVLKTETQHAVITGGGIIKK